MHEPAFWYRPSSWMSLLLSPLSGVYGAITTQRMRRSGRNAGIPVICIGNYHVGGAGKTPATLKIVEIVRASGESPFVVSRGYGGTVRGPIRVQPLAHTAREVGDEPLMMASHVPVIVSSDRVAGASLARSEGASIILLDDGFQNPTLEKDLSLIVIDARRGIGNSRVFPAGPLRAPLVPQIEDTDALIVVGAGLGADVVIKSLEQRQIPVLHARLQPDAKSTSALRGRRVLAFAGIGDPARFFATLNECGADVVEGVGFADHHAFSAGDLNRLEARAASKSLTLVTTEKDMARIRSDWRLAHHAANIATLAITLEFDDEDKMRRLTTDRIAKARNAAIV
jgi:tetraacyldisaccharide 4'-kinase